MIQFSSLCDATGLCKLSLWVIFGDFEIIRTRRPWFMFADCMLLAVGRFAGSWLSLSTCKGIPMNCVVKSYFTQRPFKLLYLNYTRLPESNLWPFPHGQEYVWVWSFSLRRTSSVTSFLYRSVGIKRYPYVSLWYKLLRSRPLRTFG